MCFKETVAAKNVCAIFYAVMGFTAHFPHICFI